MSFSAPERLIESPSMKLEAKLKSVAADVWMISYPLMMLGVDLQRNVTILRLASGKLIIHSTAPFTPVDIAAIHKLGEPAWLLDVLLRHDTFSEQGAKAFPSARYLVPAGFDAAGIITEHLIPPPAAWEGEVEVLPVEGAPSFSEIVMFHRPSRTLIVGDLVFNFSGGNGLWTEFFLTIGSVGGKHDPGMSRPFKNAIEDAQAFAGSVGRILEWDFDRLIVGHGKLIHTGAKERLRTALKAAGINGC
jgi:hypothetical protein